MLKVQPHFKLDRPYKGPFKVESLTSTNAVIKLVNDESAEPWNVSRQRLSKCHPEMEGTQPWVGHSNKLHRQRKLERQQNVEVEKAEPEDHLPKEEDIPGVQVKTRSGRMVRKPPRFMCVNSPAVLSSKKGEVVRCCARAKRSHVKTRK